LKNRFRFSTTLKPPDRLDPAIPRYNIQFKTIHRTGRHSNVLGYTIFPGMQRAVHWPLLSPRFVPDQQTFIRAFVFRLSDFYPVATGYKNGET
jgi:hypothetical protein